MTDLDREHGTSPADTETILRQLFELVENARNLPMSTSVRIERDEVLDMIEEAVNRLPEELRAARWLLKEREEFRARTRREAEDVIAEATERVARMVARTEVVKAAEAESRAILDDAGTRARQMMREAEDYCDQKLASFQVVLEKTQRTVATGRERLAATVEEIELAPSDDLGAEFFDHEGD
jgi:hypothetical protein